MNSKIEHGDIKYCTVIKKLHKATEKEETWDSYLTLSQLYVITKQYSKGLNSFLRYLELRPKWEPNSCGMNFMHFTRNKNFILTFEDFKNKSYERSIYKNYYFIGMFLYHLERYDEAINAFVLLLKKGDDRNYLLGLASSLHANENLEEALEMYSRAATLDINNNKIFDEKLSFLIGASSYDGFHQRIEHSQFDAYAYKRKGGPMSNFILLSPWETECLYRYASNAKHGIVEIGRARGGSTLLFSMSNSQVNIVSIDICSHFDAYLNKLFLELNCGQNVELVVGDANQVHETVAGSRLTFDFLFIDGDHSYEACLSDITLWYPSLMPGGIVVFHDTDQPSVFNAILDFAKHNNIEFIIPASPTCRSWENRNGSLCIARKPIEKLNKK